MVSSLETLFGVSQLEIIVPDGSLDLPEALEDQTEWLETLYASRTRDLAFFDEHLHFFLSVRIPVPSLPDAVTPDPPPTLVDYLSHLQISLEASYVAPIMSPSTPIQAPGRTRTPQPPLSARSNLAPHPAPLHPPLTPNPIPHTSTPDLQYARTEGGAVVQSYIWGEGREQGAIASVGRAFTLLWFSAERVWVALYKLDVAVVWMQTRFSDPLLCLTASATLRDKPLAATPQREPLIKLVSSFASASPVIRSTTAASQTALKDDTEDKWAMHGFEEVNLLAGLSQGATFGGDSSGNIMSVPSSRVGEAIRREAFSLKPLGQSSSQYRDTSDSASMSSVSSSRTAPTPTLRKSYRKILAAVSGIKVRMRTSFVPLMLFGSRGEGESEEEERKDAGNEERTVVLSVEIENAAESAAGTGFLVESVKVSIGGAEGAKADLIGWGDDEAEGGSSDRILSSQAAEKKLFPLRLSSVDQYNLLYVVSFAHPSATAHEEKEWPSSNALSPTNSSQRSLSISITGRPVSVDYLAEEESLPEGLLPNKSFSSRWSSILDLGAASNHPFDPHERSSFASPGFGDREVLQVPASPFPLASPTTPTEIALSNSLMATIASKLSSPVAGSKRHTIAGLSTTSSKGGDKLGRKVLTANYRASTGAILRSGPPSVITSGLAVPPLPQLSGKSSPLGMASPRLESPSPYPQNDYSSVFNTGSAISVYLPTPTQSSTPGFDRPSTPAYTLQNDPRRLNLGYPPGSGRDRQGFPGSETLMISVALLPPSRTSPVDGDELSGWDNEKIYPLDVFGLEIFVFNKSSSVKRCEVSYPNQEADRAAGKRGSGWIAGQFHQTKRESQGYPVGHHASDGRLGIVPLENHIRVGPLRPDTCQSVRMQFLALQPGIHTVNSLNIRDIETDYEVCLRSVMHVVVHEYTKPTQES